MRVLVADGAVVDIGSSMSPLLERIIDLSPSLVFASPYETGGAVSSMQAAGLPVVLMADYLEADPRGRAEWMRLIGLATGRRAMGDSLARASVERYNALKEIASRMTERPLVMTEKPMQGVWYVAGGDSYVAHLISDAGGRYAWADMTGVS